MESEKTWLHFRHFGAALLQRSLVNLRCCLRTLSCMHSGTNKPLRVKGGETD
nr:MAG TPA: hypothetical protein [Caudoviricetes sp.]